MMLFGKAIPGETPIDDASGLKVKGIITRRELSACEAENIRKATVKYLAARPSRRSARFDLVWVRRLHREMFGDVWKWAGTFRTAPLNIGVPAHEIEHRLQVLLDNLHSWGGFGVEPVVQAARLHHAAVFIHPFLNGNGRWSRLLANIWLRLHRHPATLWPEEAVGESSPIRDEYLDAIRAADDGDEGPLVALHRRYTPAEE